MVVVDANVITYLVLNGDFSNECGDLFLWDPEWLVPRLWRDELSNVLATYERRNLISRKEAFLAFHDAEAILSRNEYEIGIERILSVAERTGCSGYDSQYIALAEDLGLKLFTFDKKILSIVKKFAVRPGNHKERNNP